VFFISNNIFFPLIFIIQSSATLSNGVNSSVAFNAQPIGCHHIGAQPIHNHHISGINLLPSIISLDIILLSIIVSISKYVSLFNSQANSRPLNNFLFNGLPKLITIVLYLNGVNPQSSS